MRRKIEGSTERGILTAMIVSTEFLKNIRNSYKTEYFQTPFTKTVAQWAKDYFDEFDQAPGATIQAIFENKKKEILEETQEELIESFLSSISKEYEMQDVFNVSYWLDQASKYFQKRSFQILADEINSAAHQDDLLSAQSAYDAFKVSTAQRTSGFSIIHDADRVNETIQKSQSEELFKMPGDLGELLHPFHREDVIAVVGPAKRGKSFWLSEIGVRAMLARLKVLFISLEMNEPQMLNRVYRSLLAAPKRDGIVRIPEFDEQGYVTQREEERKGLTDVAVAAKRRSLSRMIKGDFHLCCYPAFSAGINQFRQYSDHLATNGFVPDVVVVDYADIVRAQNKTDPRHQIDEVWRGLKSFAQERKCLVATASHSNKMTFNRDIKSSDMSEDNRKLNHVSLAWALNQHMEEKKDQITRVRILEHRHEENTGREVKVLSCLAISRAIIDSRLVPLNKKEGGTTEE